VDGITAVAVDSTISADLDTLFVADAESVTDRCKR
jgi:hypothetical protein